MKHTKDEIRAAKKLIEYGSSNKRAYVKAKDTLCSLADLYIGGDLVQVTKVEKTAPDLLMVAKWLFIASWETMDEKQYKTLQDSAQLAIKKATE